VVLCHCLGQEPICYLCTREHKGLNPGDKFQIYTMNDEPVDVTVTVVKREMDFILLQSDKDVVKNPPKLASPYQGQEYFQFGLSATTQDKSPLSVSRGVISSNLLNSLGHMLGSAGANPGDSGGPCFDVNFQILFGVNVGVENVPITDGTTLFELGTRHAARAHILPSTLIRGAQATGKL